MSEYTAEERAAICPDCGCVAFKRSQHASRCPRGSDPTGAKLDRLMGRPRRPRNPKATAIPASRRTPPSSTPAAHPEGQ